MDERPEPATPRAPRDRRGALLAEARAAAARRPVDLLAQWSADSTVRPSPVDLRTSVALDALALQSAPAYDALLLSPVAPLGSASALAPTSQDRTLSTIRPSEVVSDPTNVLALEAARRLRAAPGEPVRLATVHQTLRMQDAPADPGRTRHFRLFALADAGRARPDDGFEVETVIAQLAVHRRLLDAGAREMGLRFAEPAALVRTGARHEALGARIEAAVRAEFPEVAVRRAPLEGGYYGGLRIGYGVHGIDGVFWDVVDLGRFDWVARLTSDRRHRFVASAIGIQLLPLLAAG
ncbi:MAG TPA: hypothetical protein VFS72_10910 [Agromyces sp.]|nr:hypothetical protein [Agromyces sp.]